ncbi:hypothetical protein TrST_g4632 [Triparma strigata]|uniref:Tudor domain-containing protein n=1 Tax=Triparma strigata TaxID=1606541 RepID=A0A9W7BSZ3_9STRA|nr:hypothetical protein TrST_g4632 [Triparma strigata]
MSLLALDLGLHTLRTSTLSTPSIISLPSSTLTILPCGEHKKITNKSQLAIQRCGERGNLTNLPVLKTVLEHCFKSQNGLSQPYAACILLTKLFDPSIPHLLPLLPSPKTIIAPSSSFIGPPSSPRLTVDTGFSATYVTPVHSYMSIPSSHIRCSVGGRVLTNFIREYLGYSTVKIDEWVAEMVKEKLGGGEKLVLPDWRERVGVVEWEEFLETKKREDEQQGEAEPTKEEGKKVAKAPSANKPDKKPDKKRKIEDMDSVELVDSDDEDSDARRARLLHEKKQRQARAQQLSEQVTVIEVGQLLPLILEALFNPLDVLGLNEIGVAEACKLSIERTDATLRESLWKNIIVTGGNRKIPGFIERLEKELRSLAPVEYEVNVTEEEEGEAVKRAEGWLRNGGSKGGFFSNVSGGKGEMFDREGGDVKKEKEGSQSSPAAVPRAENVAVKAPAPARLTQVPASAPAPVTAPVPAPAPFPAPVKKAAVKKKVAARKKPSVKKPPPMKPVKKEEKWFELGAKIEAQWARQKCWYPGTIVKVCGDGRYDISYADQDYEAGLEWNYIRDAPKKSRSRG